MLSKEIPIDTKDPMNGLVTFLKGENKLSDYLSIEASSTFTNRAAVSTLFDRSTSVFFQFGKNKVGEYFEIHFLKETFFGLTGYGFMSPSTNSFKPRNWNVSCMSTNPPTLLANEKDNKTLCSDVAEDKHCGRNDKQVFYCKNLVKCSNIRFTVTGPVSGQTSNYNFALAGIELFGYFNTFPKKNRLLSCIFNKNTSFLPFFLRNCFRFVNNSK